MAEKLADSKEAPAADAPPTPRKFLLRNALYSSGSWIVNVAVVMLATPFILMKLTREGYGIYALLTGLVGYYGLLDFGLGQGVTKFVAQFKATEDTDGINRSINAALWVQAIAGLTGSIAVAIFADPILHLFDIPLALVESSKIALYITACGFFFTMLSGTYSSALMGLQMYALIGKTNLIINVGLTCLIISALWLGGGLIATVILTSISALVMFLVYFFLLRFHLPGYSVIGRFSRTNLRTLASYSGYLFLSKISSAFGLYVVRFIVGYYLGPVGVTYFVIPSKLTSAAGGLLSSATSVLFPFSSSLSVSNDSRSIQRAVLETSKHLAAISVPVFLLVALVSRYVLSIWMGSGFADHTWGILTLLAFGSLLGSFTAVPNLVAMGLGHSRIVGLFSAGSLGFYLVLLPLLTAKFGLVGTGWAITISTIPGLLLVCYELRKIFKIGIVLYFKNVIAVHLPIAICVAGVCSYWNNNSSGPSLFLVMVMVIAFGIYEGVLIAYGYFPVRQWATVLFNRDSLKV